MVTLHIVRSHGHGGLYSLRPMLSAGTILGKQTVPSMQAAVARQATTVGVNGDFFSTASGRPSGMFLRNGVLSIPPNVGRSALGIAFDGRLLVDRWHFAGSWKPGSYPAHPLTTVNKPLLEPPGVALYTARSGEDAESPRLGRSRAQRLPACAPERHADGKGHVRAPPRRDARPGPWRGHPDERLLALQDPRGGAGRDPDHRAAPHPGLPERRGGRNRGRAGPRTRRQPRATGRRAVHALASQRAPSPNCHRPARRRAPHVRGGGRLEPRVSRPQQLGAGAADGPSRCGDRHEPRRRRLVDALVRRPRPQQAFRRLRPPGGRRASSSSTTGSTPPRPRAR